MLYGILMFVFQLSSRRQVNSSADADFIISRYFALFPAPKKIFFFLQL
jgi:hypothetical protein